MVTFFHFPKYTTMNCEVLDKLTRQAKKNPIVHLKKVYVSLIYARFVVVNSV